MGGKKKILSVDWICELDWGNCVVGGRRETQSESEEVLHKRKWVVCVSVCSNASICSMILLQTCCFRFHTEIGTWTQPSYYFVLLGGFNGNFTRDDLNIIAWSHEVWLFVESTSWPPENAVILGANRRKRIGEILKLIWRVYPTSQWLCKILKLSLHRLTADLCFRGWPLLEDCDPRPPARPGLPAPDSHAAPLLVSPSNKSRSQDLRSLVFNGFDYFHCSVKRQIIFSVSGLIVWHFNVRKSSPTVQNPNILS